MSIFRSKVVANKKGAPNKKRETKESRPKVKKEAQQFKANRKRPSEKPEQKTAGRFAVSKEKIEKLKSVLFVSARVLFVLTLSTLVIGLGIAAFEYATTSEYFRVNHVIVKGHEKVFRDTVLEATELSSKPNIFSVEVKKIDERLRALPWVEQVTVRRKLPSTIEIDIVERTVFALVVFDVPYLVDDSGVVFKRWVPGDPTPAPVITGFTRKQFSEDPQGVTESIQDGIDLARRYIATGLERIAPLKEIHKEIAPGFSFTVGKQNPFYVRFGKGPYRKKFKRLAQLLRKMRKENNMPAMVFLDNEVRPDRVTVQLRRESKNPPPAKISKNHKKRLSKI